MRPGEPKNKKSLSEQKDQQKRKLTLRRISLLRGQMKSELKQKLLE